MVAAQAEPECEGCPKGRREYRVWLVLGGGDLGGGPWALCGACARRFEDAGQLRRAVRL